MLLLLRKLFLVSFCAVTIDYFCGDRNSNLISTVYRAFLYVTGNADTLAPIPFNMEKLFTKEDLKLFNGVDRPQLYLAILGYVFDVSKGAKHYGPDKEYHFFVGQDASRSFVTGNFYNEDINEEVADFTSEELRSLSYWVTFYHREYRRVGRLKGKFFDDRGQQTPYGLAVKLLMKQAELSKEKSDAEKAKFPPCNVEWVNGRGTRVWCSEKSGGIQRDWVGVPRQLFEAASKAYRCACINQTNDKLGIFKEYEGCDSKSTYCFVY